MACHNLPLFSQLHNNQNILYSCIILILMLFLFYQFILFIYILNVPSFPGSLSQSSSSHPPSPYLWKGTATHIHPDLTTSSSSSFPGASSLYRIRHSLFHWSQTRHSSATYVSGALGLRPAFVCSLVGDFVSGNSQGSRLVDTFRLSTQLPSTSPP